MAECMPFADTGRWLVARRAAAYLQIAHELQRTPISYSPWLDYDGQWAPVAGELTGRRVAVAGELLPVREYLYVWKKRKKY